MAGTGTTLPGTPGTKGVLSLPYVQLKGKPENLSQLALKQGCLETLMLGILSIICLTKVYMPGLNGLLFITIRLKAKQTFA